MFYSRTFEHNGRQLRLSFDEAEMPARALVEADGVVAPGAGDFEIVSLNLSTTKISAGESITLSAQISGKNIAFIYTELLLHDKEIDQYFGPVAQEHVYSEQSNQVQGVIYPVWSENPTFEVVITPMLRVLTDGVNSVFGFLVPNGYGTQDYQVGGFYTNAQTNSKYRARINFGSQGEFKNMLVFKEQRGRSTPRALVMEPGDQFSPFVQVLIPPSPDNLDWQVSRCISPGLVYRGEPFQWLTEAPIPGEYLLGLVIQDLDGGKTRRYAPFSLTDRPPEHLEINEDIDFPSPFNDADSE